MASLASRTSSILPWATVVASNLTAAEKMPDETKKDASSPPLTQLGSSATTLQLPKKDSFQAGECHKDLPAERRSGYIAWPPDSWRHRATIYPWRAKTHLASKTLFDWHQKLDNSRHNLSRFDDVLDEMRTEGISGNAVTFRIMIQVYGEKGFLERAWQALQSMQEAGIVGDRPMYNSLIKACGKAGQLERARHAFDLMQDAGIAADSWTYNILIDAYGKAGQLGRARHALDLMQDAGVAADSQTYNILINAYGKAGQLGRARHAFDLMQDAGVAANLCTYNSLIDACGKVGAIGNAVRVFSSMKKAKVAGDFRTYHSLAAAFYMAGQYAEGAQFLLKQDVPIEVLPHVAELLRKGGNLGKSAKLCHEVMSLTQPHEDRYHQAWLCLLFVNLQIKLSAFHEMLRHPPERMRRHDAARILCAQIFAECSDLDRQKATQVLLAAQHEGGRNASSQRDIANALKLLGKQGLPAKMIGTFDKKKLRPAAASEASVHTSSGTPSTATVAPQPVPPAHPTKPKQPLQPLQPLQPPKVASRAEAITFLRARAQARLPTKVVRPSLGRRTTF